VGGIKQQLRNGIDLLRRQIHPSWLIAVACSGIVLGVAAARYMPIGSFGAIAWLMTGTSLVLFALIRARTWVVPIAILGGFTIGMWRGCVVTEGVAIYDGLLGKNVMLTGTVNEDTDINQRGQTTLRLRDVRVDGQPIGGMIWATTKRADYVHRSDHVELHGKLTTGFGTFNATMYGAELKKTVRPVPGDVALNVRDWFGDGVRSAVNEPESSLGLGFLLGQRRSLPPELDTALKAAGLTHIVVASGYNLTILVRLARRLFEKVSKYMALLAAATMIVGFIGITGLSPSMSRAGLVAGLSLLAWYYGRRFHPLVLLPFAMAVTVLVQPSYAWGDLGWQLSFAAFAGVMLTAPLIQSYFFGDKSERTLRRILIETVSAQVWTLPILLFSFGQVSVVAPLANILILPLVPLAMILTFIAGLAGILLPAVDHIIGIPAQLVLVYMTHTTQYVGGLSWAMQNIQITPIIVVCMYGAIIAATIYMYWRTRLRLEQTSLVE